MNNFQSESKKSGDEFENLVEQDLVSRNGIVVGPTGTIKLLFISCSLIQEELYSSITFKLSASCKK